MVHGRRRWCCILALTLLLVVLGAVGCGSTKDSIVGTGIDTSTFSSREFGYYFRYPLRAVLVSPTPAAGTAPGIVQQVIVADPAGKVVEGKALDVFTVSVYALRPAAGPGDLAAHESDFTQMAMRLIGRPAGFRMVRAPGVSTFARQPAIACEYFYRVGQERMGTLAYFVPEGSRGYWIRLQSSRETMDSSPMIVTLSSFWFY
jgi:hypothetical protein